MGQVLLPGERGRAECWQVLKCVHSLGTLLYRASALLQELGLVSLLEKTEIQAGVAAANEKGDKEQASKSSPGGAEGVCLLAPGSVSCPVVIVLEF